MSERKQRPNGNGVSRSTGRRSAAKDPSRKRLEQLLAAVYDHLQKLDDPKANARCRRNFVFHMMDWSDELSHLAELYKHPDKFDQAAAARLVAGFLYHVIPHLRAAGRLLLDYAPEEIFRETDYTSG